MKKKFKLYVWTGVLCDYTEGMAFAVASSLEDAISAISDEKYVVEELRRVPPKTFPVNKSYGNLIHGGG